MSDLDTISTQASSEPADFDSIAACERVDAMWIALGEQIAAAIPDLVINDSSPERALRWATCAEACFWKATGEADTHDVKDVLK